MNTAASLGATLRSQGAQETNEMAQLDQSNQKRWQSFVNDNLYNSKRNWWEAKLAGNEAGLRNAEAEGARWRAKGAVDTDSMRQMESQYRAKYEAQERAKASIPKAPPAPPAPNPNTAQNLLNERLFSVRQQFWTAKLNDDVSKANELNQAYEGLKKQGAKVTDKLIALENQQTALYNAKLQAQEKLLQAKKAWWQARANLDQAGMDAADRAGKAAASVRYVNTRTNELTQLDNQNNQFLQAKKDYYEARSKFDSKGMENAQLAMTRASGSGSSLSGDGYKLDQLNKSILTKFAEYGSLTLDNSHAAAARALEEARQIRNSVGSPLQAGLIQLSQPTIDGMNSRLNGIVNKRAQYWSNVANSTAVESIDNTAVLKELEGIFNQFRGVQLSVDFHDIAMNRVNNEIMRLKKDYWNEVDLGNSDRYIALKKTITSLQNQYSNVKGIIGQTKVDEKNTTFLTARNKLSEHLQNGNYDNAINTIEHLQQLRAQGTTLTISRSASVSQSKVDGFLLHLKKTEWSQMERMESPDRNIAALKVIAKNNLKADPLATAIVELDKMNTSVLLAKQQFWQGAASANSSQMTAALASLKNAANSKYTTLSTAFDTKLDAINSETIRISMMEWTYKGDEHMEANVQDRKLARVHNVELAKKAGMGNYLIPTNTNELDKQMKELYEYKKMSWDIRASTNDQAQPYQNYQHTIDTRTAKIKSMLEALNQHTNGKQGLFALPSFVMDTRNQAVMTLRKEMKEAIKQVDSEKALQSYWEAYDQLEHGATLDIKKLEPNFFQIDWKQLRTDKMFRDTIAQYNKDVPKADIEKMQGYLKKLGFYEGGITGSYNKELLIAVGMYQHVLKNNSYYQGVFNTSIEVDGKINSELLYMAHTDVSLGRKIHWANSPDEISSSYLNKMATVVGIGDGFVSQLVEDGLEIIDGVLALNPFDSRLYNETIPGIFELGKAIFDKKITIKAIGEVVGQTLANEFVKPFENVSNNYQYILDGHGKYSENQQFGRDLAKVVEILTVVGGTAKGAQLMARLGPQLRELFERIGSKESKLVEEKLEHNEELENGERVEGTGKVDAETRKVIQDLLSNMFENGPQWKPGKLEEHIQTRKKYGHIPDTWTAEDYNNKIMSLVRNSNNEIYEYYKEGFSQKYYVIGDKDWIVMVGKDGIMETSFPPTKPSYEGYLAPDKGYKYIGQIKDVLK
ncbi:hypothetical protein PAECIP111893_01299 [Paenibacillus plantiphilus]|uniref:Uncharacterized protein n=2 Tax=Paenibacillus plantiphilus TaxID=2905650 RepID=A0ABN8G3Z3_9BACL|nr:hypothetical protein PAECIP111893_01299 [Paenibacillus plantiphilus]